MISRLARLLLLAGGLAAPLLPPLLGAVVLVALFLAGFFWFRPPARERWISLAAIAVAAGALLVEGWTAHRAAASGPQVRAEAARLYARLWNDLDREAAEAAAAISSSARGAGAGEDLAAVPRERLFARLAELSAREGSWRGDLERWWGGWTKGRRSLLLLDSDGAAVAWAGEGLLHELPAQAVPRSGRRSAASFGGATLLAVRPIGAGGRPWRVIAGASYATDGLPFREAWRRRAWSVIDRPEPAPGAPGALGSLGALLIELPETPALAIDPRPSPERAAGPSKGARIAWAALGLAVLALAVLRGSGRALPTGTGAIDLARRPLLPLLFGGSLALAAAVGASPAALVLLAAGIALAIAALGRRSLAPLPENIGWSFAAGALAVLALAAGTYVAQRLAGPIDVGSNALAGAAPTCWRLGAALAAFGLIYGAGRFARSAPEQERWGWAAAGLALAGGAASDLPLLALPLLAAAGAMAARWSGPRGRRAAALAGLAALVAMIAGGAGETAYRLRLREFVERELPARLEPPRAPEVGALRHGIASWLETSDPAGLAPRRFPGLERDDLAFALWRRSPLARANSLSALVVEPLDKSPASVFSFGLPLDPDRRLDRGSERWRALELPPWSDALIEGRATLRLGGRPWARARFAFLPRPGFRLGDRRQLEDIDVGLLRGGPAAVTVEDLPKPVEFGLYDRDGRALLSPWPSSPPLPEALRRRQSASTGTPDGRARAVVRRAGEGWSVLYLPDLGPLAALERTGNAAVGVVVDLTFAAFLALLVVLPRAAVRELLGNTVRSYSRRLLLVYGALLLVPLVLLNAVLVRGVERRLAEEQQAAGQAALSSAQFRLAETLGALPPGFSVETTLDDRLLARISELVHHEVNLYYLAEVYASSKHELFTAGLLPERIPGDIYAPLALGGEGFSARINQTGGGAQYLEIYAPVRPPGGAGGAPRLFLSAPLLAQQEEAALEVTQLRRRALLATTALLAMLIAVGSRLAKSFTHPIRELVAGTARIAAGAPRLGFAPAELELAALGRAIDEMASRIAEGRERLLREKQVVERMIENITSGVVSLDREGRVLLHNRVAAELLGVDVGVRLEAALAASPRLAPVRAFLRETEAGEPARRTVRLAPAGKEGGGELEWTIVRVPVPGAGEPSELLVVEDATEELRAQRLLAWAEMARIIAHEIKNPLTPIRLSAEHMREVWQRDRARFEPVFERCTANILAQVDELRQIALEFSTYSSIPRIDPEPADLVRAMSDLIEGYRAAPPPGIDVAFETAAPELPARFDARLLGRAVRNLLENAIRASSGGGKVTLRLAARDGRARIAVLDSGPGVRPDVLPRIFDPYFSTHDAGTGLGLPIARRIAEEHGGAISARNREEGGLEVTIEIPA